MHQNEETDENEFFFIFMSLDDKQALCLVNDILLMIALTFIIKLIA